jgi:hypothetical protein
MFEVQVFSSGVNVAQGKNARQSSTLNIFEANRAVDGRNLSFSHTNDQGDFPWWEVDLDGSYPVESVKILNRWCGDESDRNSCLCRLSHSVITLFDEQEWVLTKSVDDSCKVLEWIFNFPPSSEFCSST